MFNSLYTTGTITITSGSPNFTTSGAALQSADIRPGDVIVHNGLALVIASITGQNSGTLVANAPAGAAGSGVPLRILMQNDGSRLSASTVNLIALLSGGNAQALAGLTGAANTGLHFTGAGQMATHPLTAAARALLGDSTVPRSGTGGTQHRNNTQNDARFMQPGDFGLGTNALPEATPDSLGTDGATGFYGKIGGVGSEGFPVAGPTDWGIWQWNRNLRPLQMVFRRQGVNNLYFRVYPGSSPSVWREIYHTANLIGTVSQSGGVPTGSVIQRGSNSNGEFVRFADGTQICTFESETDVTTSTAVGNVFSSTFTTFTFPAAFSSRPMVTASARLNSGVVPWADVRSITTSTVTITVWAHSDAGNGYPGYIAIGRWF